MISIWYLYDICMISIIWSLSLSIYIYIYQIWMFRSQLILTMLEEFPRISKAPRRNPDCSDCQAQSQRWTWFEEVPVGGCLGTRHEFDLFPACTLPIWELYSLTVVLFTCNIFQKKHFHGQPVTLTNSLFHHCVLQPVVALMLQLLRPAAICSWGCLQVTQCLAVVAWLHGYGYDSPFGARNFSEMKRTRMYILQESSRIN